MDAEAARRVVDTNLEWLVWALQLNDWHITVVYESIESDANDPRWQIKADCDVRPGYHRARIRLNPEAFENEAEVLKTLLHELLHVTHHGFTVLRRVVTQRLPARERESIDELWHYAAESLVYRLERMFDLGLGLSPHRLIQATKQRAKKGEKHDHP